jgi:tRNA(Ile)-lysidine synthase
LTRGPGHSRGEGSPPGPPFDPAWLKARLEALDASPPVAWCVAWSGGADSTALLVALQALRQSAAARGEPQPALRAVHVDHHLQAASEAFRRHCRQLSRRLGVRLTVRDAHLGPTKGRSIEEAAREARYATLARVLRPGECLLTGQHAEDQLETVLLQMLRGGGVAGLAGMPDAVAFGRGRLLRPLLPVAPAALRGYLHSAGVPWVEDPSNADLRYDRNYLRREVLPRVLARWPGAPRTVARSARLAALADDVLRAEGLRLAAAAADGDALRLTVLRRLPSARRRLVLRAWIESRGVPMPEERQLAEVESLLALRQDAQPRVTWPGAEARRQGDRLLVQPLAATPGVPTPYGASLPWHWPSNAQIALPDGGGLVLRRDHWGDVDLAKLPERLEVRWRAAGGVRKSGCDLKSLLREAGIPAWQRSRVPLIYSGDALLAVGDLWCDPRIRARAPGAGRARFVWQLR